MCTHKRQTICFCLSCLIANPFFKPDSFPVDMNFFTIKSPLDESNRITFTVGLHIQCYPIMLMRGGFWRQRELICTRFIRRRSSGSWKKICNVKRLCSFLDLERRKNYFQGEKLSNILNSHFSVLVGKSLPWNTMLMERRVFNLNFSLFFRRIFTEFMNSIRRPWMRKVKEALLENIS